MTASSEASGGSSSEFSPGSLVTALLLWLFVLVFVVLSFGLTPRARVLPQLIGVPLLLVATISLAREVRVVLKGQAVATRTQRSGEELPVARRSPREEVVPFAWVALLLALVVALGLLVGTAVFLVLFLRLYGRERWRVTSVVTAGVVLLELGFVRFFGYDVFPGYLLPALGVPAGLFVQV